MKNMFEPVWFGILVEMYVGFVSEQNPKITLFTLSVTPFW